MLTKTLTTATPVADRENETPARAGFVRWSAAGLQGNAVDGFRAFGDEDGLVCLSLCETRFVVRVTELKSSEVETVDRHLPLSRLCQQIEEHSTYLIAWEDAQPVGHAHIAWSGTHLGLPEIQDVFVLPEKRRLGIATQLTHAAEEEARTRGWNSISLSVSQEGNAAARLLYAKLGYVDAGVDPVRVSGQIMLRGRPFDVDDTLVYLVKDV